ncbi:uncharacterized protein BCR38DRAFT_475765 [Pseudomassariella vexata]|uniref:FAD-binding PCMH-type domain-containing protein n=1 Tax=Pseudomassariella vexata TaxID=1141098 RepID=A0A1Y2DUR8_9PEZI|nr:uncharacterized protein BCR38DRAFT_475765 [Pseudomassariella vexata]ORY62395.1 hypothetical protein BCR38DRAFT_475765 [Pseudomassariella vexata]
MSFISLSLLAGLFAYLSPTNALTAPSPATSACSVLTSSLGAKKVASSRLSLEYISSKQDYWNARQSSYKPTCVIYPEAAEDVSVALKAINAAGTRFAIKAGGHNTNDFFSSVDDGVLIDLGYMTAKSYDESTTLATYEPGNRWGDLYNFYQPYGRTVMGGRLNGVGSGLALGGGLSYLSPQYGMACDSFRELEVVLPSGEIVTASNTSNPDLFLGLRGGGGNAYGVVTKYTVQSRPAGKFFAGNIVYLFQHTDAVVDAVRDFTLYNLDPKASVMATYETLTTPDLNLNLDEVIILFVVYDGEDPGTAFANFTSIPNLVDTSSLRTYPQVTDMPVPLLAQLTRADNIFRMGVHHIETDTYKTALKNWRAWASANKGQYTYTSFNLYPVAKSLTDASKAQGGNALQMPDGPWLWSNYVLSTPPDLLNVTYEKVQASFRDMVAATPMATDLPLFLNEAAKDQNALATFSTYSELQKIKRKYDPDGFFETKTGGWSFA